MDLESLKKKAAGVPVHVEIFETDVLVEPMWPEERFFTIQQIRELRTSDSEADPEQMDTERRSQYIAIARAAIAGHVDVNGVEDVLTTVEDPLWRLVSLAEVEKMFAARLYGDDRTALAKAKEAKKK